jgi:hypothetical protein
LQESTTAIISARGEVATTVQVAVPLSALLQESTATVISARVVAATVQVGDYYQRYCNNQQQQ